MPTIPLVDLPNPCHPAPVGMTTGVGLVARKVLLFSDAAR
jgi:hypothetical protein